MYYGRMNLFAWMNLHDLQLTLSGKPWRFIKPIADYHVFLLADKNDAWYSANGKPQRHDAEGSSGSFIGQEIDIVAAVDATRHSQLQIGYGVTSPGTFVRSTGPAYVAHWGFSQASYAF
jgi:hypothetical protein